MTLDELHRHAADLFPQASAYAIHRPGERNEAFEALERLCWDYYKSLGFNCMVDCFAAVAPRIEGRLSRDAWSSARVEFRGWIIETSFQPLKFCGRYAHIEIFHDGELPGVTETGYLSRFIPMAAFSDRTQDDFHYAFGQAGWTAWRKAWQDGKLKDPFNDIWLAPQPVERLFDTQSDPMEVKNLAADPAHAARLAAMRERLKAEMVAVADTGIIPEPMFESLAPAKPIANYLAARKSEIPDLVAFVFTASSREPNNLPALISNLNSEDPITRYWAAQGCLILGKAAAPAADALSILLDDDQSAVRVAAAHELAILDRPEGSPD